MDMDLKKLFNAMKKIVGKEHVFTDKTTSLVYAKDVMPWDVEEHNIPYAVVRPAHTQEVSKILKYANEKIIPVHIHGSGTSLVGLARPKTKGIVLDTARMKGIKVYPERGYYEVGPGVHVAKARKALDPYNALLPIFPGSELVATVGGAIAVNTSAHGVDAALGKPGDYVLGLEAVLPNGDIIKTGTESMRKPAGIEPTKFLVGSEGLLCVLTSIRMRIIPKPYFQNIVAFYPSTEDILDRVMEMYRLGIPTPIFFEFLDENAVKVGFQAVDLDAPEGAVALLSIYSSTEEGCSKKARDFLNFLMDAKPLEARIVRDSKEWDKIWSSRAEAGNYIARLGTSFGSEITPRVDMLKEAYSEAKSTILNLENLGNSELFSFGHIGAPSIHASAFFRTKQIPNETKKALVIEVREKTEAINVKYGGCGGEWGLGAQRISFLKKRYPKAYYDMLVALKKALDPNNILNRGNLEGWM